MMELTNLFKRGGSVTRTEHLEATRILQHLFNASSFVGIDFGSGPNHHLLYFKRDGNESWLSIEGPWYVHSSGPSFNEDEQLHHLVGLRRERVRSVRLTEDNPNLELTFESGSVLFVNGYHEQYESWQAGDARPLGGEHFLLVAMPQGDLAVFAEDDV
ncbi:MAG: DUF6188 family protein [Exiguobacterium chiriqhucha]|jgi:hypothetical protein|uniref:DUF6188 family protein n=2 Tax=Bacillales Family XII. Incertae Sedis TaxID=539742 RepID=A0ABT7MNZ0_9BACL|nr:MULTISPECIES: DUF6188 family protein [Exiguobacterium]KAB2865393.1 MAG: hypothetical protein F9K39_01930 [Exiguobacterium chiriqhucha]MDL5376929.1 DUF6188 family protein [Exiguobacterium mexicanum]